MDGRRRSALEKMVLQRLGYLRAKRNGAPGRMCRRELEGEDNSGREAFDEFQHDEIEIGARALGFWKRRSRRANGHGWPTLYSDGYRSVRIAHRGSSVWLRETETGSRRKTKATC